MLYILQIMKGYSYSLSEALDLAGYTAHKSVSIVANLCRVDGSLYSDVLSFTSNAPLVVYFYRK
jgi:hypothetical protein